MYVADEVLRGIQLTQVEILLEFDRICKKHNLSYVLWAGSMLGAVRHKGFIPWDDDIDVALIRKDYERFLEICKTELDSSYFLQNNETEAEHVHLFSRLRKNDTYFDNEKYKKRNTHHGIFIDVFPLDNVMPNTLVEGIRCSAFTVFYKFFVVGNFGVSTKLKFPKRAIGYMFVNPLALLMGKKRLIRITDKVLTFFNKKNTGYLNHLTLGTTKGRFRGFLISEADYYDVILIDFEGHTFPIPRSYDKLLRNRYGDYMKLPPEKDQKPLYSITDDIVF